MTGLLSQPWFRPARVNLGSPFPSSPANPYLTSSIGNLHFENGITVFNVNNGATRIGELLYPAESATCRWRGRSEPDLFLTIFHSKYLYFVSTQLLFHGKPSLMLQSRFHSCWKYRFHSSKPYTYSPLFYLFYFTAHVYRDL